MEGNQNKKDDFLCPDVKVESKHGAVSHCSISDNLANNISSLQYNCESWNCLYTNANSILTKMSELKDLVTKKKYQIIGITECWARNEIDDSKLHIDGYVMHRHDRPLGTSSKGGGVLLYIKDTLHSEPLLHLTNSGFTDSVWAQTMDIFLYQNVYENTRV